MASAETWQVWSKGELSVYKGADHLNPGDYIFIPDAPQPAHSYRLMRTNGTGTIVVVANIAAPPEFRTHLLLEGYTNV